MKRDFVSAIQSREATGRFRKAMFRGGLFRTPEEEASEECDLVFLPLNQPDMLCLVKTPPKKEIRIAVREEAPMYDDWAIAQLATFHVEKITCDDNLFEGPRAAKILSEAFENGLFGSLTLLRVDSNDIQDAGMISLAGAIARRPMTSLESLSLSGNRIGHDGMRAFAAASGSLGALKLLNLSGNRIGDDGMTEFSRAISSGSLGGLKELSLGGNNIGDDGMAELSRAISSGSLGGLKQLYLFNNQIGDAGMADFSKALASGSMGSLQELWLNQNQISDDGMKSLSAAITSGSLPGLVYLYLYSNPGKGAPVYEALSDSKKSNAAPTRLTQATTSDSAAKKQKRYVTPTQIAAAPNQP